MTNFKQRTAALAAVLFAVLPLRTAALAAATDELLLYMGNKVEYTVKTAAETGGLASGSDTVYEVEDTVELTAQALSSNKDALYEGFIRQAPARELLRFISSVKAAVDTLSEKGRADLIVLACEGNYTARSKEMRKIQTEGNELFAEPEGQTPERGLGGIGANCAAPLLGDIRLRSVYGETYAADKLSFSLEDTVFDTGQGDVYSVFNGYIAEYTDMPGTGAYSVTVMSDDRRVRVKYTGMAASDAVTVGKRVGQGDIIGKAAGYAVGVSLSVDGKPANLLNIYGEQNSKVWFGAWRVSNPDTQLADGGVSYHMTARELSADDRNSYTNPEVFDEDNAAAGGETIE